MCYVKKKSPFHTILIVLGSSEDLLDGYRDGKVGINDGLEHINNDYIVLGSSEDLLDG